MLPDMLPGRVSRSRSGTIRHRDGLANLYPLSILAPNNGKGVQVLRKLCLSGLFAVAAFPALAAPCSDTGGKYEEWKPVMAEEARALGVGEKGIAALMGTSYSKATISADRNQKSFKYSLEKFLQVRVRTRSSPRAGRSGKRTPVSMTVWKPSMACRQACCWQSTGWRPDLAGSWAIRLLCLPSPR